MPRRLGSGTRLSVASVTRPRVPFGADEELLQMDQAGPWARRAALPAAPPRRRRALRPGAPRPSTVSSR